MLNLVCWLWVEWIRWHKDNLSACLDKWREHRTQTLGKKSISLTLIILSTFTQGSAMCVFVRTCLYVFMYRSDIKPLWLRFHWKKEKSYACFESAALQESRADCGLYSGSIAPYLQENIGTGGLVVSTSLKLEAGERNCPPPIPLASVSVQTQEHPQRSTTMEGILP